MFNALFCQVLCIILLANQQSVYYCIHYFVALEVIMEVTKLYFESLIDNKLRTVVHHPPKYDKEIKKTFSERSLFHQVARVIYKIFRAFYISCIYYFVPYYLIIVFWVIENNGGSSPSGH